MTPLATYQDPDTSGLVPTTLQDIRRWIATHPLGPDEYGKGYVTPFGHRIAWITKPMYGKADGWPAHIDGIAALGYLDVDYDEHWRNALATFRTGPNGIQEYTSILRAAMANEDDNWTGTTGYSTWEQTS